MKTNRIIMLISVLCFSLLSTGCGEALMEMTPEEEAIVSLYASKAVAKFNKNQVKGIANARVKPGELDDVPAAEETEEAAAEETVEENATEETIDPETGEPIIPDEGAAEEQPEEESTADAGYSFTDAVDIAGVSFTCSEFDVTPEYKASSSFVLSKIKGKQYLILSINAENTSSKSVDFSSYANRSYSLKLNGGEESASVNTFTANDLSQFDGALAAGEKKDFILVFSFSNSSVENITSLELLVTSDGATRGTTI